MINLTSSRSAMTTGSIRARVRLLAIMEGSTVSGPAKNLVEFWRIARDLKEGPIIEMSLLLFDRHESGVSAARLSSNELMQQALRDGIPVYSIPERYAFDRLVMGSLREVVGRLAPDVIQTHGFKSHFLVRACGLHKGRAWIAFHHGYTTTTYKRALLAQLDRWSLKAPSQVVTVSHAFSQMLTSRGISSGRIMVLHNAVDPDWLLRKPEGEDSDPREGSSIVSSGEKLVLAVGRLSKEKGFLDLVAAIGYLKEMRPGLAVRLAIVGEGLERVAILGAVRRAGLEQQVCLMGHVKDVRPYYRAADLLAISSLSEGSPNALLEAMAAGVPVVSTAVGGIPEIVSHRETAFLVPPRDPMALAQAIEQLLSDRSLTEKMATRARELIHTQYSPLSRATSLLRLYERLCSRTNEIQRSESSLGHIVDAEPVPAGVYCPTHVESHKS